MSISIADNSASVTPTDAQYAASTSSVPAIGAETEESKGKKKRKNPNKSRVQLAYTTIWALEDMLDAAQEGRAQMEAIRKWIERERLDAKGRYDTARLARLGELDGMVADLALKVGAIERLASDARVGIYEPAAPKSATEGKPANGKQ